jgi:site-specific DNA-methyltransferase (adenine-specific)
MRWCLENYSKEGDFVLDPFLGSGTTARACKDLGRKWIGCEIEQKYCDIAVKRLAQEVLF